MVGIGVTPAVGFLDGSGIGVGNGIVVDERFETNVPDIYAAGDVACFFDPLTGRRRRIEHWSNARYQGNQVSAGCSPAPTPTHGRSTRSGISD